MIGESGALAADPMAIDSPEFRAVLMGESGESEHELVSRLDSGFDHASLAEGFHRAFGELFALSGLGLKDIWRDLHSAADKTGRVSSPFCSLFPYLSPALHPEPSVKSVFHSGLSMLSLLLLLLPAVGV